MKYESADPADVQRYIDDDRWCLQQKLDGIRAIVKTDENGKASFSSHTGEPLRSGTRHFPKIAAALSVLRSCTVDGELLETGELWLFDVLEVLGTDTRLLPQTERRKLLETIRPALAGTVVHVVDEAVTATAKTALWASVLAAGAEGVVAKRRTATYALGSRRSPDVVKIKQVSTVDCVVAARDSDGHLNATLGLYDGARLVTIGNCSMLGKPDAQVGDVVEIRCLGRYGDKLCQPRMMRLRPDKPATECTIDQLGAQISRGVLRGTA